jgi:hypothetical protein
LREEPPAIVEAYGLPVPPAADFLEEEGLERTKHGYDWLLRFEIAIRRFIDQIMTATYGADWPRHRLPNGLYDAWEAKRAADIRNGRSPQPIIAYADFTDYERIICKSDNWPLFLPMFRRPENLRESMQRLQPIRLCTMHARLVTQDDLLFLYCETRRVSKAIGGLGPTKPATGQ